MEVIKLSCDICGNSDDEANVRKYTTLCYNKDSNKRVKYDECKIDLCEDCVKRVSNVDFDGVDDDKELSPKQYNIYHLGFNRRNIRAEIRQWMDKNMIKFIDGGAHPKDLCNKMFEDLGLKE